MKRAPKLTKRERKAAAPPPVAVPSCVSVNLNFEPPLQCTKPNGHQPPRHRCYAPPGTTHQGQDVGGKVWYWADYQGMAGYRKGEMLDPKQPTESRDGTYASAEPEGEEVE